MKRGSGRVGSRYKQSAIIEFVLPWTLVVLHFCSYCRLSSQRDQREERDQEVRCHVIPLQPLLRDRH